MKFLFVLLLIIMPLKTYAQGFLNAFEFQSLTLKQKVETISAYKEFVEVYSKDFDGDFEALTQFQIHLNIIESAYATEKFDCFYGGWPSRKKTIMQKGKQRTFCSSPQNTNPAYKALSQKCGSQQMLCQPVLFGSGLCIDAKTSAQRNSAFSQCQKLFSKSGKSMEEIVKEASSSEESSSVDELFELVHDICKNGFQANTGMCGNLKTKIASIKAVNKDETPEEEADLNDALVRAVETVNEGNKVVSEMNNSSSGATEIEAPCEDEVQKVETYSGYASSEPVDQNKATPPDYCSGGEKGQDRAMYSRSINDYLDDVNLSVKYQGKMLDDANSIPGAYTIRSKKIGTALAEVDEGKELKNLSPIYGERSFKNSFLGRGKESSFEIIELPIKEKYVDGKLNERYLSTNLRITQYAFFPRKVVPSVKTENDKIIMKMTTGEEVVVDSKSGKVIAGAAKEVATKDRIETRVDDEGNKDVRTFSENEFSYSGDGLYIQTLLQPNLDEKDPGSIVPVKAIVNGVEQECKLKSEDIWVKHSGHYLPEGHKNYSESYWSCRKYKFEKDTELYELIKKTCPEFKFPALAK